MRSLHRFIEPADFLAQAESFLRAAEAENVLMLGICSPGGSGRFDDSCYLATVEEHQAVVACALRTPPYGAVLTRADREALKLLVTDLVGTYPDLPAAAGPEPAIKDFAELWSARAGVTARPAVHMRLFEARHVLQPPLPAGSFRVATEADLPIAAQWAEAFFDETGLNDPSDPSDVAREQIRRGSLFIWEDTLPVSMAAWAGRTGRTARINSVYTPPEHRGRGYASACVASLTQRLLDEGLASCCLYTDLANPTSNKIYQALGYRPVSDVTEYHFEAERG
jgi:uncharacterized protein